MSCVLWTRHFQCALTDHYFRLIPGLDSFSKICKNTFFLQKRENDRKNSEKMCPRKLIKFIFAVQMRLDDFIGHFYRSYSNTGYSVFESDR